MEILGTDDPICVAGKLEAGEDRIQIIANEIHPLAEVATKTRANGNGKSNGNAGRLHLYARESEICPEDLVQLREALLDYPGPCTVFLHLLTDNKIETVIELPAQVRVAATPELEQSVSKRLGSRVVFHLLES